MIMAGTPSFLLNVFEATTVKLDYFLENSFAENIHWLQEIEDAARKAFGSASISLLPKTPSMKRKRPDVAKANEMENNDVANKHASTFMDGTKTKKLKIDDMSAIVENIDKTLPADTTINTTQNTSKYSLRAKNNKKKKTSVLPVKRSRRLAAKSTTSYIESPLESTNIKSTSKPATKSSTGCIKSPLESTNINMKQPSVIVIDTPEDTLKAMITSIKASKSPALDQSPLMMECQVSPDTHLQPRVAALIEKLHLTAQKSLQKQKQLCSTPAQDELRKELFANPAEIEQESTFITGNSQYPSASYESPIEATAPSQNISAYNTPCAEIAQKLKTKTPISRTKQFFAKVEETICQTTIQPVDIEAVADNQMVDETYSEEFTKVNKKSPDLQNTFSMNNSPAGGKLMEDSDESASSEVSVQEKATTPPADISKGRRDTYKVVVMEKELPKVSTPQRILAKNMHKINVDIDCETSIVKKPTEFIPPAEILGKGPKIFKPIKSGNIVTGIKSFIKRAETPKKETEEEKKMKKAAELERKENQRMKIFEENHLKKQKILEQRKRQREEREKRFAEQQAKRQEEEERKRKQLELKTQQMNKNREELRKQRELEERKKRELRELKKAEADARRQKEDEEQQRKVAEIFEEEKRRQEMLQRKAEYEEQERLRKKIEHERADKERLKLIEEERFHYEERKKREFEEKEQHRIEVDRKQKEDKEKERIEKLKREERIRQAEREIEEGKRRELDCERAKLREEIKSQINHEKQMRGNQFTGKVIVNTQNALRSSPRLASKDRENFVIPGQAVSSTIKSPAAFKIKKPLSKYNPPKVPMLIRESDYSSYSIDDLSSDDSTDDECEPAKRVPSWAKGMNLRTQLMQQFYANIDPELIFVNCMDPCRLDKIFQRKKERYFKRTSSAHWTSPILKSNHYNMK